VSGDCESQPGSKKSLKKKSSKGKDRQKSGQREGGEDTSDPKYWQYGNSTEYEHGKVNTESDSNEKISQAGCADADKRHNAAKRQIKESTGNYYAGDNCNEEDKHQMKHGSADGIKECAPRKSRPTYRPEENYGDNNYVDRSNWVKIDPYMFSTEVHTTDGACSATAIERSAVVTGRGERMEHLGKKKFVERLLVDTEERLELIFYFLQTYQIDIDRDQVAYEKDFNKKLLILSGVEVAVRQLVTSLQTYVLSGTLYRVRVDVKLDFESQLVSEWGRKWFSAFTCGASVYLLEEKRGKSTDVLIVSYNEAEANRWAGRIEAHFICAKIPYEKDIRFGDSKWRSTVKDWRKNHLIAIGIDKFRHNIEVYGVPYAVIAALDEVDAFVNERETEKRGILDKLKNVNPVRHV